MLVTEAILWAGASIGIAIATSAHHIYRKHTALRNAEALIATAVLNGDLIFTGEDDVPRKQQKEK